MLRTLVACALLLLGAPLSARTVIALGGKVEGRLAGPSAIEVLEFDGLQGATVTITAAALKSSLRPRLELWDRTTDVLLAAVDASGKKAALKAIPLPRTGPYELRLLALDGSSGRWSLSSKTRLDKSLLAPPASPGLGGTTRVVFAAHAGTVLGAVLRAAKGSAAAPGAPVLVGPSGPVDLSAHTTVKGPRTTLSQVLLPEFGLYTLEAANVGGAGELLVGVKLLPPRASREILVTDALAGALTVTPDVVYSEDGPAVLTARVALGNSPYAVESVRLLARDDGGEPVEVATLVDDGELGFHGDEIAGDGVYTAELQLTPLPGDDGLLTYEVIVDLKGPRLGRSAGVTVLRTRHVTDAELDLILSLQTGSQVLLDQALLDGDLDALLVDLEAGLAVDPLVAEFGRNDGSRGLWVRYHCGLAGVLCSWEDGAKGGDGAARSPRGPAAAPAVGRAVSPGGRAVPAYEAWLPVTPVAPATGSPPADGGTLQASATAPGSHLVGSTKAYALAAQHFAWGDADDVPQMATQLLADGCYDLTSTAYAAEGAGSVEDWKDFGDFGLVLVSTHGDSTFATLSPPARARFGWTGSSASQVCLHTNMAATPVNLRTYEDDLLRGRLVLWYGSYAITPAFLRHHSGRLAEGLVYVSACNSARNDSLAAAFADLGAGAFLGYSDAVAVEFCAAQGPPLLEQVLAGQSLAEAYAHAAETDDDPAEFLLWGSTSLALGPARLHDTGFESGNPAAAWSVTGDVRILTRLGSFAPTAGGRMAILSTGLGFAQTSGSLSQTLCLPADATAIRFDWNLLSAEWLWWCGSIFQDTFEVELSEVADPANTAVLLRRTIDDLCGQVSPTSLLFDKTPGTPPFENGQEAGDVYATGWTEALLEIPAELRGREVRLHFRCFDVGDSEWDTAVLLDDVELLGSGP